MPLLAAGPESVTPAPKLWSLRPPVRRDPPRIESAAHPIDAFLAAKRGELGLRPNGPASKRELLRRVHFDLTGLPPTPEQQDRFLSDTSPDAYENVVDGLLRDPQHGVRWGRHWLDVLRYADLDGLDGSVMPAARGIHLWRDWVIASLNADVPYDQFVRAQILGNRYSSHTTLSATGRRTRGEADPRDQFALGFLARSALTRSDRDRDISFNAVETVSSAFLGMTVACAKCHDHRFDPISQRDYYAMKALFDPLVLRRITLAAREQLVENGEAMERYRREKEPIDEAIEALIAPYRQKLFDERVAMLPPDVREIVLKPERKRTIAGQKTFDDYFPVLRIDPPKMKEIMPKDAIARYDELSKKQRAVKRPADLPGVTIVEEDSARLQEKSYILTSGDPTRPEKDKPVEPGFPFKPSDIDFRDGRREGFTDWLTAKENPLFARVAVNRIWQWHFGEGLHKNPSDFGLLGGRPSNQPLLDYLAVEFANNGYRMKWLHRLIVTSDAYKMSSKPGPHFEANTKIDGANAHLWRFRLKRLEAEPVWDSILLTSGNLDPAIGGKSFQPVNPDSKQSIFLPPGETFESRSNRRAAYMARGYIPSTEVMSSFLAAFDVDDGRTPCPLRQRNVTAPQALFSMNDPMIEAAAAKLAERARQASGSGARPAAQWMFRAAIGRDPDDAELDRAMRYVGSDPSKLSGLAWTFYNLDEFLFVR